MKYYVGIDLGTTNSAICTNNGRELRIWKSPEQNDVTPSVIFLDRRGNRYVGKRAYDAAPNSPGNAAMLFKRLLGSNTPVQFEALGISKTPEECSAEILKTLFGYLPEEIRQDEVGVVITVPAAFNQMQKNATLQAATLAGLGKVCLMQEPVAAVMSVVRELKQDGTFLIYDLGGGTLDIAIATNLQNRINLLAHGGIQMCGGRDIDRLLLSEIVCPWLENNFKLPKSWQTDKEWRQILRLANWATEKAKIELSAQTETRIILSEHEIRRQDLEHNEIWLDIELTRTHLNNLIANQVTESVQAAQATLEKAGLKAKDIQQIVFIGGPTNYKPLRDQVCKQLGIKGDLNLNPMTAVAEGAAIFAESVDWQSQDHSRKKNRAELNVKLTKQNNIQLVFRYQARTAANKALVAIQYEKAKELEAEFQIDSLDSGWTSGKMPLKESQTLELLLSVDGENTFKVFVFDKFGEALALAENKISITKTAAIVEAIPASNSIAIEVLDTLGGKLSLDYLVRAGDRLPVRGKKIFRAAESLRAGEPKALNFKIWEGDIEEPISDNRPIGLLKITGKDFATGTIPTGAELECEFEILDSGAISLEVSVPCISGLFNSGKNFYSRQESQLNYGTDKALIESDARNIVERMQRTFGIVDSPELEQLNMQINDLLTKLASKGHHDAEDVQELSEKVLSAKRCLASVRRQNLRDMRQLELDNESDFFETKVKDYARESEIRAYHNLVKTAQRAIDRNEPNFEHYLRELAWRTGNILWRQDWYVAEIFYEQQRNPQNYSDKELYKQLIASGKQALAKDDFNSLRSIVNRIVRIRIRNSNVEDLHDMANIVRG